MYSFRPTRVGNGYHRLSIFYLIVLLLFSIVQGGEVYATSFSPAQQYRLDSLQLAAEQAEGEPLVRLYLKMFETVYYTDVQQALNYGEIALEKALLTENRMLVAGSEMNLASAHMQLGEIDLALHHHQKAETEFMHLQDTFRLGMCWSNMANIFVLKAELDSALAYVRKSLKAATQVGDSVGVAIAHEAMASNLAALGRLDSALLHYLQALDLFLEFDMQLARGVCLGNLGELFFSYQLWEEAEECFSEALLIAQKEKNLGSEARMEAMLGRLYSEQGDLEKANSYYVNLLALLRAEPPSNEQFMAYLGLGKVALKTDSAQRAKAHFQEALKIAIGLEQTDCIASGYLGLGQAELRLNAVDAAKLAFESGLKASQSLSPSPVIMELKHQMGLLLQQEGRNETASAFLEEAAVIRDSLSGLRGQVQLSKARADYKAMQAKRLQQEMDRQQAELASRQDRIQEQDFLLVLWIFIALAGIVALGLIGYFLKNRWNSRIRLERRKRAQSVLQADQKAREDISRDLHDGVGQLLTAARYRLNGLSEEEIPQEETELEKVDQLLEDALAQVRTTSRLSMPRLLKEQGLEAGFREMLSLSLGKSIVTWHFGASGLEQPWPQALQIHVFRMGQELVSNTLKHAKASHLRVSLFCRDQQLHLLMEDDGIGFDFSSCDGKGAGLSNLMSRTELLQGTLSVERLQPKGQITKIILPTTA
ncbi:MAG: tetratricopeptide repeat protein [Salibacteraceae bacterium]